MQGVVLSGTVRKGGLWIQSRMGLTIRRDSKNVVGYGCVWWCEVRKGKFPVRWCMVRYGSVCSGLIRAKYEYA